MDLLFFHSSFNTRFLLGCNVHFAPSAHPICTLAHLCCSYNTYTVLYVQYTKHACADTLTPYPTVTHSHLPLGFSRPISICALLFLLFISLSFPLTIVLSLPHIRCFCAFLLCRFFSLLLISLSPLLSLLSFVVLICARSLSFISLSFLPLSRYRGNGRHLQCRFSE